jgi:Spy/CpxP family protein refolding chaperone
MKGRFLSALAMIPLAATLTLAGADGECGEHGHDGPRHGDRGPGMHGDRHGGGESGMRLRKQLDELNLSADQKKKVDAIFETAKKERDGDLRAEYGKLHELLEQEKPDSKAVDAQVEKIGEMKTEQHKAMLKTLLAVRAELTPEQREKLKEMKTSRRDHWRRDRQGKGGKDKAGAAEKSPKAE